MPLSILMFFVIVTALVFALRMARIGALCAFLLAGIVSGPYVLNMFQLTDTWSFLGELGILFLWFSLGLEINIRRLWNMRHTIFGFGAAQVLMVAVMMFPLLFGITDWTMMGCVMVALMLAMSSTSEDLSLLTERNQLNSDMGRQTFSILLFQDLLSIPLLAMMPIFSGKTLNLGASAIDILVSSAVLILGVVVVGRFVLNPLMKMVAKLKSREAFLLAVMLNIIVWAVVIELMGMPAGLGAFLAGMLMSETIYRHQISAEISPYAMLFLAFFFIALGMGLNLPMLVHNWYIVVAGVIGLVIIKFVAIFIVARVRHVPIADAVMIALLLAQGGEFGLLMIQTMKSAGIDALPERAQEILTAIIILSIMATPLIIAIYDKIRLSGNVFATTPARENATTEPKPDVIICGFGRVGQIVAQMMEYQKISYVAMDVDVNAVMQGRNKGFNVVYGDCRNADVLRDFGLAPRKTRAVIIALDNETNAKDTVLTVRGILPKVKIFARARNLRDSKILLAEGANVAQPEMMESSFFLGYGVLQYLGIADKKINDMLGTLRNDNYAAVGKSIADN